MAEVGFPALEDRAMTDFGIVSTVVISAVTGGAVTAAVAKAFFDRSLESRKAELQKEMQIVSPQIEAYRKLWALTEITSPSRGRALTEEERRELEADLRRGYYKDGNGIFLSLASQERFLAVKKDFIKFTDATPDTLRDKFSALRTELKNDITVYGPGEKDVEVGM
jgi:hypothetical protein